MAVYIFEMGRKSIRIEATGNRYCAYIKGKVPTYMAEDYKIKKYSTVFDDSTKV